MITKILLAVCILITATAIMSMFLTGCTSDADKEYEDSEQMKYIEEHRRTKEKNNYNGRYM